MEWLEHDSLLYYRGCIYVPDTSDLRRRIVSLCHNTKVAGHQGCFKTLELASRSYWWPNMSRYIGMYVSHCNLCLHTKIQCHLPTGELQLLPIPEEPWGVISIDFISDRRNGSTRNWNNTSGSSSEKDRMTGTHSSPWRSFPTTTTSTLPHNRRPSSSIPADTHGWASNCINCRPTSKPLTSSRTG